MALKTVTLFAISGTLSTLFLAEVEARETVTGTRACCAVLATNASMIGEEHFERRVFARCALVRTVFAVQTVFTALAALATVSLQVGASLAHAWLAFAVDCYLQHGGAGLTLCGASARGAPRCTCFAS